MADGNMYVLNPVFKADTFKEMVEPLTMYAQAYKEQEAKIEDMTDKAAALEWIANNNPESQTAALYKDMSDKIKGIRDDLMMNGLMGGTRSRILGARRMYSANSAEITRRYEDMQKYQQRMEQLYDKDNSMVFSPESQNISIDDFAGGRRPQIKAISGNEVMARGAAVGKRLTSQIFGDGVDGTVAGQQFWKLYKENGMTDEALAYALNRLGQDDKYAMAKRVIDGVYNSFADFTPLDQQRLKDRFIEGVYSGAVYARDVDYKDNGEYMDKYKRTAAELLKKEYDLEYNKYQLEKEKDNFLMGKDYILLADGSWLTVDPRTNEYVTALENEDGTITPIKRTKMPKPLKDEQKETEKEEEERKKLEKERRTRTLGIDQDGNAINVANNKPLGKPLNRKEHGETIDKIKKMLKVAHQSNIVPGMKYRYYEYTHKVNNKTTTSYYAEPVGDQVATTGSSSSGGGSATDFGNP